jgi:hypothetical protein
MPDLVNISMSPQPQPAGEDPSAGEVMVWTKYTWGSFGQHANLYTFVILPDLSQKPIFEVLKTRHENRDSSKNVHRFTYVSVKDLLTLNNCIIKRVSDYASSRKRKIDVQYYYVCDGKIQPLETSRGLRDSERFYDEVKLNGKRLIVRKDRIEVME